MIAPASCSNSWSSAISRTASRSARARCPSIQRPEPVFRPRSATSCPTWRKAAYITSPHTSAGRVPTPRGYRLFVDTLLTVKPLARGEVRQIEIHAVPGRSAAPGQRRLASAGRTHRLCRRRADSETAQSGAAPDRIPQPVGQAHPADHGDRRRRGAEPGHRHRPKLRPRTNWCARPTISISISPASPSSRCNRAWPTNWRN
jgi:hypothetical protein